MNNDEKPLTTKQALSELRKPGKIYIPMVGIHDIRWMQAVKADLIWSLEQHLPHDDYELFWDIDRDADGDAYLSEVDGR